MVSNRHLFSFNFVFGNSKKSQGAKSGEYGGWGMTAILCSVSNCVDVLLHTGCSFLCCTLAAPFSDAHWLLLSLLHTGCSFICCTLAAPFSDAP
jgi:hypothetical protein